MNLEIYNLGYSIHWGPLWKGEYARGTSEEDAIKNFCEATGRPKEKAPDEAWVVHMDEIWERILLPLIGDKMVFSLPESETQLTHIPREKETEVFKFIGVEPWAAPGPIVLRREAYKGQNLIVYNLLRRNGGPGTGGSNHRKIAEANPEIDRLFHLITDQVRINYLLSEHVQIEWIHRYSEAALARGKRHLTHCKITYRQNGDGAPQIGEGEGNTSEKALDQAIVALSSLLGGKLEAPTEAEYHTLWKLNELDDQ